MLFHRFSKWNRLTLTLLSIAVIANASDIAGPRAPIKPEQPSIALPGGSVYMTNGIYASLSGGRYLNFGEPNSLYQWQGEMGYYYTSWFSGGVGFKLLAGEPSDSKQVIENRFFLLGRFHKSWSQFSGYLGSEIGMEDLNIALQPDSLTFRQPLEQINAGLALEFGLGWKFSRYVGLTFEQRAEGSFVGGDDTSSIAGSINFRTMPGIAVDMLAVAPPLRKNVKALYLFVESQFGQLVLENRSKKQDFAWITGVTVAF